MHAIFASAIAVSFTWLLGSCRASSSNGSAPEAVVISPSEYFEGNDGPWSSFNIRVGTPEQIVRVLVSTASPESMVVLADYGCSTSVFGNTVIPSNCAVSRGVLFNPNQSSTWDHVGNYAINGDGVGLEANLGYTENAEFALETLGIGLTGPSLKNQTVAGIATADPFYLGIFGLNNQPVNFTSLGNYSAPSFLSTLKSQGLIPSLSWSYTAGAQYRLKQVYGQLIFSGYDTSRFNADNSVSFTMAGDLTRDLVVVIQSISYSGSNEATLLSDPIQIFIDSTDPNLWLPDSVCDAFESALGLTMDNATGLYLVNETHHTNLLNSDAEVTFRLSDVTSGGDAVTVTLPYAAFALMAEAPLVQNSSYYFPLKRAANETQYTLGRTFLQEAYLSADYERGVFNVSACTWNQGAVSNIVTITSKDDDGSNSSTSTSAPSASSGGGSGGLSPGAIAGIVIGCVVVVALIAAIIVLKVRRRDLVITYAARDHVPEEAVMSGPVFNSGSRNFGGSSVPTGGSSRGARTVDSGIAEDRNGTEESTGTTEDLEALAGKPPPPPHADVNGNTPPLVHELPGESSYRNSESGGTPTVVHELPGLAVPARTVGGGHGHGQEDTPVSEMGTSPSPDRRQDEDNDDNDDQNESSPLVSTMGTTGWRDVPFEGGSDLVSPITPVHHGSDTS